MRDAQRERERTDRRVYAGDSAPLLSVQGLSIAFPAVPGEVPILDEDDNPVMDGDNVKSKRIKKCGVWTDSHMWKGDVEALKYVGDDETSPRAMYGMTRYKTCDDGERKKIDTICAAARIMDM